MEKISFNRRRKLMSRTDIMYERLEAIRAERITDANDVLVYLRSMGLVSKNYNLRCASVDLWYLNDRERKNFARMESICEVMRDPHSTLMMCIIISALNDALAERPCDLNKWRVDYPPGAGEHCMASGHICSEHAKQYLLKLDPRIEAGLNLSPGFIRRLLNGN